ncbi:hypothetical protein [Sphingobium sp. CFD-2]|uniref:gp53-like domain-containing protein n=1 Tax=Sphingobium sp. CFD-2 TaxID=2878542 RepID=UPI00214C8A1B|nr:hypothetical protein [Sphingobium sp. CFD-2]
MALTAIVTSAGRAALVNAANTGTAPVTIAQVGLTATAVVPGVGITALPGEYKRVATISGDVVADDTIHLIVRDESTDVFTVRSFALYLADGTLFAIYGQAGVILEKSAQAMMLLAIDVQFADVAAAMLTFGNANFLNPPATTEMQGVVKLATVGEAQAGIDALRALTPAAAKAAILGWLLAQDGSGSGLDADLLDGQDGSYYANIPQRLGYAPANRAGDTFTGNLAISKTGSQELHFSGTGNYKWRAIGTNLAGSGGNFHLQYTTDNFGSSFVSGLMLTTAGMASSQGQGVFWGPNNDGAGSGLDADLLDGQDGSYYANITQRLGYTPWHPGNDGAGSGLDADLLDGLQASQFMRNANGTWVASEEGAARFFFSANADTYARVKNSFRWQNSSNNDVGSIDEAGNLFLNGQVDTTRVLCRANGDGQAVKIGDDAFIGDVNIPNGFRVTGIQDPTRGFINFGNSDTASLGRIGTGHLIYNGNIIWHAGNDGAGSGCDSDMLDGLHASAFGRSDGSTTYTGSINVTADNQALFKATSGVTPTVIHRVDATNYWFLLSNAAAGLNSTWNAFRPLRIDLATGKIFSDNGQEFSGELISNGAIKRDYGFYLDLPGNTPILNFDSFDYINYDRANNIFRLYIGGSERIVSPLNGNLDLYASTGSVFINNKLIWNIGNDGSGSGLDADLLDGYQASDLAKYSDFANNLSAAGYQRLPSGLILQWCTTATQQNVETTTTATFPIQFPNAVLDVQLTTRVDIASVEADTWYQLVGDPSLSGCTVMRARSDNDADRPSYCRIFALGR